MKILIYSLGLPPFRRGGLTNYSVDLSEQLSEDGNQVTFVYPGEMSLIDSSKCKFKVKQTNYGFTCFELINPLPVSLTFGNSVDVSAYYSPRSKQEIKKFISQIAPDVVHIHTLMGLPIEFLNVLKEEKIRIVYTTHDYYGLCPKMLSKKPLQELSYSKCSYDCMMCQVGPSITKIKLMQSHLYQSFKNSFLFRMVRKNQSVKFDNGSTNYHFSHEQTQKRYELRRYYMRMFAMIDIFHFNSSVSKKVFKQYLPNINGKVVPLVIKELSRRSEKKTNNNRKQVNVGFLGGTSKKKGFLILKKTADELFKNKVPFQLFCAGSNSDNDFFKNKHVVNLGMIPRKNMDKFYDNIDLLVVPSLWHETFGLVVVEAITNNVPVICSNLVGAKDLLPSECVFDDQKGLYLKLKSFLTSYSIREKMFRIFDKLEYNTDFKQHTEEIIHAFY